jgi:hypothetical protein
VASALTEPYFQQQEEKLIEYTIRLANAEIEQQKTEEVIGTLWEATDILHKMGKLQEQILSYSTVDNQIEIHLAVLLGVISGDSSTRKYKLPNVREVSKILKQEKYILGNEMTKVDGKVARRWVIDLNHAEIPEVLKNMFSFGETEQAEQPKQEESDEL